MLIILHNADYSLHNIDISDMKYSSFVLFLYEQLTSIDHRPTLVGFDVEFTDQKNNQFQRINVRRGVNWFEVQSLQKDHPQIELIVVPIADGSLNTAPLKTIEPNNQSAAFVECPKPAPDDFEINGFVGRGAHGSVYEVKKLIKGKAAVVKVIDIQGAEYDDEARQELLILQTCKCDFIVAFHSFHIDSQKLYLFMEFMDFGSIDQFMPIPDDLFSYVTLSITSALIYLYRNNICHRDIKPENILVNSEGEVKLCDFSSAKRIVTSLQSTYSGTNMYMSPERCYGQPYNAFSSDMWALGVTLVELLLGWKHINVCPCPDLPFTTMYPFIVFQFDKVNQSPLSVINAIVSSSLPDFSSYSNLTDDMKQFLSALLNHDPTKRPTLSQISTIVEKTFAPALTARPQFIVFLHKMKE